MSKNEALERWIEVQLAMLPIWCQNVTGRALAREIATKAWHAAVKHTLEHVVGEVNKRANAVGGLDSARVAVACVNVMRNLAVDVAKMKP